MLTELDKKLIAKEEERFPFMKLKPLLDDSNLIKSIEDLFEQYEIQEITQHWYDSEPKDETGYSICEKCEVSSNPRCNKNCNIWNNWEKSEQQLSFNNWIDVYGPGIWDMTQEESDEQAKNILSNALTKGENLERLFFSENNTKKEKQTYHFYDIFYYNRDRKYYDWWFVFRRKNAGAGSK